MRKENLGGEAEAVKEVCVSITFQIVNKASHNLQNLSVFSMRDKWKKHARRQKSGRRETTR